MMVTRVTENGRNYYNLGFEAFLPPNGGLPIEDLERLLFMLTS